MSNDVAQQQKLAEFWNSTAPMSQVREGLNLDPGQYDFAITKLEPGFDDNGLVFIQLEVKVVAGPGCSPGIASLAAAQIGNTHRERLYIGSKVDPEAKLPETRLNSAGFSKLKGVARVCQLPTNDQAVGALCGALLHKQFGNRIDKTKSKKDGKEYTNLARNATPFGMIPARLDSEAATPGAVASTNGTASAPVASVVPGAEFGAE